MEQQLGVPATGHSVPEKFQLSTFFAVARNFVCTPASVFPARETMIEHLFANDDRLSEHIEAWVTKTFPPSGTL